MFTDGTNRFDPYIIRTITVICSLFAPSMIEMKSIPKSGLQLKPSIHQSFGDNYDKFYYRRVLVTVYLNKDTQFRAALYDRIYVANYTEEYTDKIGNVTDTADSLKSADGFTVDNLIDNAVQQKETFAPTDTVKETLEQATEYKNAYDALTDDQKDTLKNVAGFDSMSIKDD